jgi:hypothetical protein
MEPMQDIDLQTAGRASADDPRPSRLDRAAERLRPAGERAVLWLHRQAERMDLIPDEFGKEAAVDEADGGSLAREWLRQARLWAGYNPEEMLALKVGAVLLGAALVGLIVLVRALG